MQCQFTLSDVLNLKDVDSKPLGFVLVTPNYYKDDKGLDYIHKYYVELNMYNK